ncbi:MAG: adenylate/guanylate cyclase domain-containing protein, partial [Actinomycetota bacterium]|nr:adenylate/guanylate cyclase domain-containing protein [Actinomycetota bacterium]
VTFLFTDIEGSTRLLDELGAEAYAEALAAHRRVMRQAFAAHGGVEVDTQGDAFFAAFPSAAGALEAATRAQAVLAGGPVRVRMGIHSGDPLVTVEGYVGIDVHQGARLMSAAHGGQVVVSEATRELLDGDGRLVDLGLHRLKDLMAPQRLWQLGDGEFPPLKTLYQTNLPVQPTPLVGRERELAEVLDLLRRQRLVTLTGAGGSGKTRLALQAAAELTDEFSDGVWWVSLAALRDPALVEPTVAQVVGATDDLGEHVRAKRMLLLLDNFEQVVDAAPAVGALLASAPDIRVLVTSRERLALAAEHEYVVPTMEPSEALALFTARARQLKSDFKPDAAVAEICRRLDGLPLAIELAAVRVKLLRPEQILGRLGRSLDLLTAGTRDAPERHQTLRATIEWSYELLSEEERQLFARIAVFGGSFSVEAAEEVCEADLDTVAALVDKSLLRETDDGRFFVLETIHEYARERLAAGGNEAALRRRHAGHYLALAEEANLSLDALGRGPQRHELVLADQHNLRAAIVWATENDVELGLRLAVALENFWVTHDPSEGARRFESLLCRAADVDRRLRARAVRDLGGCLDMAGETERARVAYEESRELFSIAGDEAGVATADFRLGVVAAQAGDLEGAERLWEGSLTTFTRLGDAIGELQALGNLGWVASERGDRDRGRRLCERSRAMARLAGWVWWELGMTTQLAEIALESGLTDAGEQLACDVVRLARSIEDRASLVFGLGYLARAAAARGDTERASKLWAAIEAEEAKAPISRWSAERERHAAHIPEAFGPVEPLDIDGAV